MNGGRRIVHGTPIGPGKLLQTLAGGSFCVSFACPRQTEECIELVGDDEILILDNGAFSIWRADQEGRKQPKRLRFDNAAEYRVAFWNWANEIQARCPQAIAVIPDVIMGSEKQNLEEISHAIRHGLADYPERTMSIWHMDDSQDYLALQCRLLNFIGIGSCAEFDVQQNRAGYLDKMRQVYTTIAGIEAVHGNRPWCHLMRGLGVFHEVAWADSADSTNVARNHCRNKQHGENRARYMHDRISSKIQEAAARLPLAHDQAYEEELAA